MAYVVPLNALMWNKHQCDVGTESGNSTVFIKKDSGISISHLNNREKTKITDALRQTYPLTGITTCFGLCDQCYGYRRLYTMLRHEELRLSEKVVRRLWWRNSLSSVVTVVAATTHIAEKSDRLRITLSPEILRRSNLIRNG